MMPPKPASRRDGPVSLWRYARLFRDDILSAQPDRLYGALMAEFRTPFFRSCLVNDPALIERVLGAEAADFPKSARVTEGLRPLLGRSVFVTNGAEWERQRRIIDPAFAGGRLRELVPAMDGAARAAVARLGGVVGAGGGAGGGVEIEAEASHAAADVIFRTLFSLPIEHEIARATFERFRAYQRAQPILNLAALVPLPAWMPRFHRRGARAAARDIRRLIGALVAARSAEIAAGRAPDDLATRVMTMADPATGTRFTAEEMVDQVAIFFLAGHETSASALAWALYLLASHGELQERVAAEVEGLPENPDLSDISSLSFTRDVMRETLRLYPPVPMMVRESRCPVRFRDRDLAPGTQVVLSPWHLQRHRRFWAEPDRFDPDRWQTDAGRASARSAYLPFSAGARVCIGAGFAMIEGVLLLARLVQAFRLSPIGPPPVPVAHLTVRARDGIRLALQPRARP